MKSIYRLQKSRGYGGLKSPDSRFYIVLDNRGKYCLSHIRTCKGASSPVLQRCSSLDELLAWMREPANMKKFNFPLSPGSDPLAEW